MDEKLIRVNKVIEEIDKLIAFYRIMEKKAIEANDERAIWQNIDSIVSLKVLKAHFLN